MADILDFHQGDANLAREREERIKQAQQKALANVRDDFDPHEEALGDASLLDRPVLQESWGRAGRKAPSMSKQEYRRMYDMAFAQTFPVPGR